jgi:hypothetical protein
MMTTNINSAETIGNLWPFIGPPSLDSTDNIGELFRNSGIMTEMMQAGLTETGPIKGPANN